MEKISNNEELKDLIENKIIGELCLNNSSIEFRGKNNILFCNSKITIENCKIRFTGSNSLIYIDKNEYPFSLNIRLGNDSVFYLGKNCFINKTSNMYATERKNIIIGDECLLSYDNYFRTADPHIIYDVNTKKRINFSKSILIGDHVWIGQSCLILKGTKVGSGAIVGGNSVSSNKTIESNCIYAGNPIKKIKENVCYNNPFSTHDFTLEDEKKSEFAEEKDIYKFEFNDDSVDLSLIDEKLSLLTTVEEKLDFITTNIVLKPNKNRFCIK